MAGIGFALRQLARRDALGANLLGYAHAAVAACGPWLFTIAALFGIEFVLVREVQREVLDRFSIVVIYNFAFSMVVASPIVMVVTRLLADSIHRQDTHGAVGMLLGATALLYVALAAIGVPFYGFVVDMAATERLMALICLFVIGAIWLAAAYMSALKSYVTVSLAFGLGTVIAFVLAARLGPQHGSLGMLSGFCCGLAVTLFVLYARIFVEFPYPVVRPFAFLEGFGRYRDLALAGLFYNAAVWVDKWILWFAPGRVVIAGAMPAHPVYDGAMFLAYLSILPSMVLMLVAVETRFHEHYLRFYRDIENHATVRRIRANHRALVRTASKDFQAIAVLQIVMCYLAILVAPGLIGLAKGGVEMVPIFRFASLGALFHALLVLLLAVIAYFDFRRLLLWVSGIFLVTNATLSVASVLMGPEYHGYGYLLSTGITLLFAYVGAARLLARLPYMTFVANNTALD